MENNIKLLLEEFIINVLNDDEGISEKAYDSLCILVHEFSEFDSKFMNYIDCSNDRFYLSYSFKNKDEDETTINTHN